MSKPNFIFILCDQMRADFLGTYGCEQAYTPNIDALGEHEPNLRARFMRSRKTKYAFCLLSRSCKPR